MLTCTCGKEFETEKQLASHKAKCKTYQNYLFGVFDDLYNKGVLQKWFDLKNTSFRLCELLNKRHPDVIFNTQKLINYCKSHNIKTPSVREGNNSPRVKYIRKTNNNLAKGTPGYIKRNQTVREKYGVSNVFQLDEIKEKSKQTMLEKYGVPNPVYLPWFKSCNGMISKPHKKVSEYLQSIGYIEDVDFFNEPRYEFVGYNEELKSHFSPRPDILIPELKIVIEVYGDRWHANPKKYKADEIIGTWYGELTAKEIWLRDALRVAHIETFGYKVIILWESDINNNEYINILNQHGISIDKKYN